MDFDRLNAGMTRFSAGAVNVRTGNFVYFDSSTHKIAPEHVMASGALPPGFPAVEIDGEQYWDGGLVSNTPLQWVIESNPRREDTLAFQVDLWSSQGQLPRNMAEVATRHKEIQFSAARARAPANSRACTALQRALDALLGRLPADLEENDDLKILKSVASDKVYNIVQLIYRGSELRRSLERLRIFSSVDAGSLARGLSRRSPHTAPSRGSYSAHELGWRFHIRSRTGRS